MAKSVSLLGFALVHLIVCVRIIFCAPGKTQSRGGCNFESKNFCNWQQEKNDIFDWTLNSGRTPSAGTGPSNDHTRDKGGKGYYAFIEASSPRTAGNNARLRGGPFSGVQCLQFAYSMLGNNIGQLNVHHILHGHDLDIWTKSGQQKNSEWNTDNVTVYGNNYYIVFEAITGNSYRGDIAIDDIRFVKGSCNGESFFFDNETKDSGGKCNFDLGLCDWANDLVGVHKSAWRLSSYRGRKKSYDKRPDHGGALGGKFLYAAQAKQRAATTQRLISKTVCGQKCVEFFYFMEKFTKSEFRLSARKDDREDRVWFTSGRGAKRANDWTRAVVEINNEDDACFELVFEAKLRDQQKAVVGMDDVFVANGSCCPMINTPEDTAKANCDFDEGTFCNWRPSVKSIFSWSLGSGPTKSGKESGGLTGPSSDASGKGRYAYIESSEPQMSGDKAILVSELLAGQQCMQFKYHMNGEDTGSLSIYRRGFLVWKEIGNHGNQWLEGQVDFDCSIPKYHVEIEATVDAWRGDIAIDELRFTPGFCPVKNIDIAAGSRPTTPAPMIVMPPPYSVCTFGHDLCGWTNSLIDDGEWQINSDDTASFETGPQYDSDGNGYYIYMEASNLLKEQEVRLESQEFFTPICLHFHYHMYGKDAKQLRLEQRDLKDNSTKVLWSVTGEQQDYWHSALQDFYGEHYTVSFVAVRGDSYLGDIALDEIAVNEAEECKVLKEIGKNARDVGQNPKEGNCDFENKHDHFCKWINGMAKVKWTRNTGRTPSSSTGPKFDHTKGKGKRGHYIYLESSSPARRGDKALLLVKLEGRAFCMRFWYHMYGDYMGSLMIMRITKKPTDDGRPQAKDFGEKDVLWKRENKQGENWLRAELDLEVDRSFRKHAIHWIGILGTVGGSYTGDIAVDDIEFEDGRCSSRRAKKRT